jgi:hypothetical protein
MSSAELRDLYNDLAEDFRDMKSSFIGNAILNEDFKQINKPHPKHHTPSIEFQSMTSNEIFTTNIFGEIGGSQLGTRLSANGNIDTGTIKQVRRSYHETTEKL